MDPVIARLNGRYLLWFILLIPLTLGIGSVVLWLWRRSLVYQVDAAGIMLWSGRSVAWNQVRSFHFRKKPGDVSAHVTWVDIQFAVGRGFISPRWLANGEELIQAFRERVRDSLPPEGRMRANYTQRRR